MKRELRRMCGLPLEGVIEGHLTKRSSGRHELGPPRKRQVAPPLSANVGARYQKRMNQAVQMYFAAVPDDRKGIITKLHDLIIGLYPDAEVDMSYEVPTYKVKNGWVALPIQKSYVSLYTCSAHHIAEFKKKHPRIKTGKECINFKANDPIPVAELKKVIRHAIQNPK